MKRCLLFLVSTAVALVLAGLASSRTAEAGIATATSAASVTFTDTAGDAGSAPDVTTVVVSDDAASGLITFTVNAAGLHPHSAVNLYLNTDKSGDFDYWIHYQIGERGRWSWNTSRRVGTAWEKITQSNSMNISPGNDLCTFTFGKWDLGGTSGFRFNLHTVLRDATGKTVLGNDYAPDKGTWLYDLSTGAPPTTSTTTTVSTTTQATTTTTPPVRPVIAKPIVIPAKPTAGRPLTVIFQVARSDDGRPLKSGTMVCDPSVGGKLVKHAEQFRNGLARLAFNVPGNAKGKQLKVKLTIRLAAQSSTRITTFRIT